MRIVGIISFILIVTGVAVIYLSFFNITYLEPFTYTKEISGVSKSTVFGPTGMLPHRFGQLGGFQVYICNALAGDIIHIYYETGENQLPNSPLFFAIVDEANYTGYPMLDGKIAHSEYAVSHSQGGYIEDWNWTVPYDSNWHFIFDFRQTFRENFCVTLTRYWIGTDYVEATDYREATKALLPSYSSYIGVGTLIIGIIVLTGSVLKSEGMRNREKCPRNILG
jgi:hypothetical protein